MFIFSSCNEKTLESVSEMENTESSEMIEGYCFLAAIPKAYLLNDQYPGWLYPDRNNMYQDKDYDFTCNYYVSPELNAIYNDQKYIMRTQEEFENFCNASAEIKNLRGDPVISSLWKIDFERNALLAYFIPMDQKYFTYQYGIIIDGNKITTDLIFNDDAYHGKKNGIYMISAVIPKKYLTEKSYDGWTAPDFPPPVPDQIPEIDRNQYSETALLLTTDDIFLYGAQQIDTSFSGKYVMHGEDSIAYIWDDLGMYQNQEFQDFIEAHEYNFDFDQYPESDENYLFMQYLDADYKLIPYAFVIDGNTAEFLYTEGNYQPGHYCFYAAVPEELIQNFYFPDWH